jgi:hypothetical protein
MEELPSTWYRLSPEEKEEVEVVWFFWTGPIVNL